jgi:putative sterol carrier protein
MNTLKIEGAKVDIKVNTIAPIAASRLTSDVAPPDVLDKMKPEFIAPLVLYLCSERCPVSGRIYNAGCGYYGRAAVLTGPGTVLGDGREIPTVEAVAAAWEKIQSLEGGKEYGQLLDLMGDMLGAFAAAEQQPAPQAEAKPSAPGTVTAPTGAQSAAAGTGITSVKTVFEKMPQAFRAEKAEGVNCVFQYTITGEGGGEWFAEINERTCRVAAGKHLSPVCTLIIAADDFLALMNGKLPAMEAYTSGKLKIEGDLMKAQLIGKLFKM